MAQYQNTELSIRAVLQALRLPHRENSVRLLRQKLKRKGVAKLDQEGNYVTTIATVRKHVPELWEKHQQVKAAEERDRAAAKLERRTQEAIQNLQQEVRNIAEKVRNRTGTKFP